MRAHEMEPKAQWKGRRRACAGYAFLIKGSKFRLASVKARAMCRLKYSF